MKTNLKATVMLTAAVLTLGATAAYGEEVMKANVPFAFRTAAGVQPAGEYSVGKLGYDHSVLTIRNLDTLNATIIGMGIPDGTSNDGRARLVFRCGNEAGCALSAVWVDGHGTKFKTPHLKPSELERVAVIYLDRKASE